MSTTPSLAGPGDLLRGAPTIICIMLILSVSPAFAWGPNDPSDAHMDPDGDGLDNLGEFHAGTNPLDPDTDNGGVWDGWEVRNGFDPTYTKDDLWDSDNDGWSNFREFIEGTDPRDPNTDDDLYPLDSSDPYPLIPYGKATPPGQDDWEDQEDGATMGQGQQGSGFMPGREERPYQGYEWDHLDGNVFGPFKPWRQSEPEKDIDFDGLVEFISSL
jgi:hypothetical protein